MGRDMGRNLWRSQMSIPAPDDHLLMNDVNVNMSNRTNWLVGWLLISLCGGHTFSCQCVIHTLTRTRCLIVNLNTFIYMFSDRTATRYNATFTEQSEYICKFDVVWDIDTFGKWINLIWRGCRGMQTPLKLPNYRFSPRNNSTYRISAHLKEVAGSAKTLSPPKDNSLKPTQYKYLPRYNPFQLNLDGL